MGFKKYLESLKSYEAGKPIDLIVREFGIKPSKIIKLASNENPLGTPKKARKIIKKSAQNVFRYPDDSAFALKAALAKKYSVDSSNVIIGHGSDQIIDLVVRSIAQKGTKILTSATTFAMYGIYARQNEASIVTTKSGIHKVDEFIATMKSHKPDIIALCVPNNPLGDCLSRNEVYEILNHAPKNAIVMLDCAYNEFAAYKNPKMSLNPREIIKKYKNCVYLGTFSKLYGLGGLRVGYGIADESIIKTLAKLRAPFNVTNISLNAAIAALDDKKFVAKTLKNNIKEMAIYENFAKKYGVEFIESWANFITFILPKDIDSTILCSVFLKQGVILRDLKPYGLNAVRITIGTKAQNRVVLDLIWRVLQR